MTVTPQDNEADGIISAEIGNMLLVSKPWNKLLKTWIENLNSLLARQICPKKVTLPAHSWARREIAA